MKAENTIAEAIRNFGQTYRHAMGIGATSETRDGPKQSAQGKAWQAARTSITQEDIEREIGREYYYQFPGTMLTVCCLILTNGQIVTGQSLCLDPIFFSTKKARKKSRKKACEEIHRFLAFRQHELMHAATGKANLAELSQSYLAPEMVNAK